MTAQRQAQPLVNPLERLHGFGQAVWLDFLSRRFIADGGLKTLIEKDGLTGVTSNPSIFEKAIAGSTDYDTALQAAESQSDCDVMTLYERLAVADIQRAADALRLVYEATDRRDGYVSLEVSPYLAMNTEATLAEARRLWREVGRENLMIKVPGTKAGLPAIRQLIGEGINVNITLLFSQQVYQDVVEAYQAGLEQLLARRGDISKVASVASFFVSRIDVAVDTLIEERLPQVSDTKQREALAGLRGKIAIANAKLAYQHYKRLFAGARWETLKAKGAPVQRLLWASTGTKNPKYRDVLYVEELIAADTVNTMPPATMDAFRDHGKVRASLEETIDQAKQMLATLGRSGISLDAVTAKLVDEGVQLFADAFDKLLGAVAHKRKTLLGDKLDDQISNLSAELEKAVTDTLEPWRHDGKVRRLWAGGADLWTNADEAKWLGWLTIVEEQRKRTDALARLAEDIRRQDFTHILLLLGMGGSSLGPEVFAQTFGRQNGRPELLVLDSTDPAQIRTVESKIDPARTLFIVSSKSGSTLEPNILKQYFFDLAKRTVGGKDVGSRFIAITDPGSKMQAIAEHDLFRHIAFGIPSIGGRYSVLSDFGMVPAAAMGLDIGELLATTQTMVRSCGANVPPAENPGVVLGTVLGVLGKSGRDKITIIASSGIADFGAWLEQLLAELTGKQGRGLIPVDAEPLGAPQVYAQDRLFVYLRLANEANAEQDAAVTALERAHPVVRIAVTDRYHIGQEFFRWEIATAVAGSILGIDPFDQPDVEASKDKTRELTTAYERTGALPPETALLEESGLTLFALEKDRKGFGNADTLAEYLAAHFARIRDGDYCALLAYVERNSRHRDALQEIRVLIRDRKRVATCLGFGPRFLHSTGQVYKGGPNKGVFLQITCDDPADLQVPEQKYTFGVVKAAQARGDLAVLAERGRRVLRIHLGAHVAGGLTTLKEDVRRALA